jgi:hypothetical protein
MQPAPLLGQADARAVVILTLSCLLVGIAHALPERELSTHA